jgi:2-dehydro-3-deoxygluconokinase
MYDVLTLGETMACLTAEQVGSLDSVRTFSKSFGGAETNTAIGLARLGSSVAWISRLGDDGFGDEIIRTLRGAGVDVSLVRRSPGAPTGLMLKEFTHPSRPRVHYYRLGSAASELSPDDLSDAVFDRARIVYLSGITPALGEGPRAAFRRALDLCREKDIRVSFDPNFRPKLWSLKEAVGEFEKALSFVDDLLLGEREAMLISGAHDLEGAFDYFNHFGVSSVVVRREARGAWAATKDDRFEVPGIDVDVVDPIGAGDAFNAGYLYASGNGDHLEDAIAVGNWVASRVVSHPGDWEGLPTRSDYERWISDGTRKK